MADLTVAVFFTENTGDPAEGLVLNEIDLYLTRQDRATGADAVVWDGTQNPTEEIDNCGAYIRIYADGDLDVYNYYGRGEYTGAIVLDTDNVMGAIGINYLPIGTAVEFPYQVVRSDNGLPIDGVQVWFTTDIAGANIVWMGYTLATGWTVDVFGNAPRLDPGVYFAWRQVAAYSFTNPDQETVT